MKRWKTGFANCWDANNTLPYIILIGTSWGADFVYSQLFYIIALLNLYSEYFDLISPKPLIVKRKINVLDLITGFICLFLLVGIALNIYFFNTEVRRISGPSKEKDGKYDFTHQFTEEFIETEPGANVHIVRFPKPGSSTIILFLGGTNSSADNSYRLGDSLLNLNAEMVYLEYRGSGKSTGKHSERAMYHDGLFIFNKLQKENPGKKILVLGHSLGATIAARIAMQFKPYKVVLLGPLYSLNEKYKKRPLWFYRGYEFATYHYINKVKVPLDIVIGADDPLIEQCTNLYGLAKPDTKFTVIPGFEHLTVVNSKGFVDYLRQYVE